MTARDWHSRYIAALIKLMVDVLIANCPEPELRLIESQLLLKQETADSAKFEATETLLLAIRAKLPLFE